MLGQDVNSTPAVPPGLVLAYPLMRTTIRGSLITEDLLRLAYCKFCSPSGVHSLPALMLPSHHRQLSQNKVVGSYSLSFNGLTNYYTKVFYMSTHFFNVGSVNLHSENFIHKELTNL